ncbi:DNA methylase [Phascolarctobacterium sp.]|uniref:Y-family DNA polymerase n=1 Tax=Phascolarctobacterium sp. TaxID=2049039 RepID=UPI003863CA1C
MQRVYFAIDLKSFYASVECVERGLNPLDANLVVADISRTEKTICLAVSPSLKAMGIPGRPRLFEVVQKMQSVNAARKAKQRGKDFIGKSYLASELAKNPQLEADYIIATPRMAHYIEYSTRVLKVYLRYIAPEDIHIYSIDEVFMDVTKYLQLYKKSPRALCMEIIQDVLRTTGITATGGIGTNMYLAKVAMDIVAKHKDADENGVRIAALDEQLYRRLLWNHQPITDFWRVGRGYAQRLAQVGIHTMGDIALCSIGTKKNYYNEELLYKLFGINAELLIDHAWGYEPCTIGEIKAYHPAANSVCSGQVLHCPYETDKARLVLKEMADALALELSARGLVAWKLVLTIGYDRENMDKPMVNVGKVRIDRYGRKVPEKSHGTISLPCASTSADEYMEYAVKLFNRIVKQGLLIRKLSLSAIDAIPKDEATSEVQLSLFASPESNAEFHVKQNKLQQTILDVKERFGKNALFKALSLEEGATGRERNMEIGGHRA